LSLILKLDTAAGPDTGIQPGIGSTNLLQQLDASGASVTAATPSSDPLFQIYNRGSSTFYLGTATAPEYGYFFNFPEVASGFVPKGITSPIVDTNSLFYSYFTPTGYQFTRCIVGVPWTDVASNFLTIGTTSVLQGGTLPVVSPKAGAATTTLNKSHQTLGVSRYPKVRVSRTVQ